MSDRNTRSRAANKRKLEALTTSKTGHTGLDVSSTVRKAQDQGGSLDEPARKKLKGDIRRDKSFAPDLSGILPKDLARHILDHRASRDVVSQVDNRINPRKGGAYKGYLLSSTRVSSSSFDSDLKEVNEPLSPNPYARTGTIHRTHTTPFNLAGPETNTTRTVNAPSWANITVDSFIETKAKKSAVKYGRNSTFHFRLDTHNRSTVGYAVDRGDSVDEDQRWKVVQAQYQRKFGSRKW
jgi:hypothetical protein